MIKWSDPNNDKGVYEYNIQNDEWADLNTPMIESRWGHACLLIDQKEIIVVGGLGEGSSNFLITEWTFKRPVVTKM